LGEDLRKKALIYKGWKLIYNFDPATYELYNLHADRNEQENRWDDNDTEILTIKTYMQQVLKEFPGQNKLEASELELNEEQIKHLQSLGYVE